MSKLSIVVFLLVFLSSNVFASECTKALDDAAKNKGAQVAFEKYSEIISTKLNELTEINESGLIGDFQVDDLTLSVLKLKLSQVDLEGTIAKSNYEGNIREYMKCAREKEGRKLSKASAEQEVNSNDVEYYRLITIEKLIAE